MDDLDRRIIEAFATLNPEGKRHFLAYGKYVLEKHESGEPYLPPDEFRRQYEAGGEQA